MFILWALIGLLAFILVYVCVFENWNFFSRQNVKFVRGLPLFGSHYRLLFTKTTVTQCFRENYRQFPNERLIGIYDFGGCPVYLIRDPNLIHQVANKDSDHFAFRRVMVNEESDSLVSRVLFCASGKKWRDLRTLLSMAFNGVRTKMMVNLAIDVVRERCEYLRDQLKESKDDIVCDIRDTLRRIMGDSVASCAFGLSVNSIREPQNDFFNLGSKLSDFTGKVGYKFMAYNSFPAIMNFFKIPLYDKVTQNYYFECVQDIFKVREEQNIIRHDLIDLLLEVKTGRTRTRALGLQPTTFHKKISDADLIAQPYSFFFGGFSSLTLSLGFTLHELAVNPDIQEKLYAEIKSVEENLNGVPFSYDDLGSLKYAEMIVFESLRKWSVALVTDRLCTKTYILENYDGTKVQLNPGDAVWFLLDALTMDPKIFPNPDVFDPERFSDENRKNIPENAFLPFGSGGRMCIAARFAIMNLKADLYYLLLNFKFNKCERTQDPLRLAAKSAFVEPEKGFWTRISLRNSARN